MAKPAPSRVAAALDYLERLKSQATEFGGGVAGNLADRARSVGGLAYEALTSDPNMGRMTTAEFSEAASRPTPRLDQAAQDFGTISKAIVTQPIQTGKAIVQGEIDRAQEATTSPRAAGEYAGSFIDPMRIAAALRKTAPIAELDVYHGTPHRFPGTQENPLGEFDASKIGTGEGAQVYGHGVYLAENPGVARSYIKTPEDWAVQANVKGSVYRKAQAEMTKIERELRQKNGANIPKDEISAFMYAEKNADKFDSKLMERIRAVRQAEEKAYKDFSAGSFYKADLPDEMIDRMLDYDKPLSEQPTAVRESLKRAGLTSYVDEMEKSYFSQLSPKANQLAQKMINGPDEMTIQFGKEFKNNKVAQKNWDELERLAPGVDHNLINDIRDWYQSKNGADLYTEMSRNGMQDASERLRQMGIPGIKYRDAGSRGNKGDGTRNFVVFPGEEKKVKILKRD